MYLSWDHPTLRYFDEDYFLDQLVSGQTDYCSSLLVNSILAYTAVYFDAQTSHRSIATH
jgi:hypothetical protein